jgi:hypothetical protein
LEDGVFLTATALGWDELSALSKAAVPGAAPSSSRPAGPPPGTQPLEVGERSALHAGRFPFYGDPELLDRIKALLRE